MTEVRSAKDWIESSTEPTETEGGGPLYPGVKWLDTSSDPHVLKRRNTANDGWVTVGAESGSPLTTKGDLYTHDGTDDARLPVVDGKWLKSNSAETTGLEWADPPGAYAETIGDGSTTSFAVTHNLGTEDVQVQVWDVSGADPVLANGDPSSVTATDTNTVTVAFGSAPSTDQYRVVVLASAATGAALLHVEDEKTAGTDGGGSSSGSWVTRDLNTVRTNDISGASLASDQITLQAGTYYVEWSAPANRSERHQTRLYNTTASTTLIAGTSEFTDSSDDHQTRSFGSGRFTVSVESVLELQHRLSASKATNGWGVGNNFGEPQVFSVIKVWEVA